MVDPGRKTMQRVWQLAGVLPIGKSMEVRPDSCTKRVFKSAILKYQHQVDLAILPHFPKSNDEFGGRIASDCSAWRRDRLAHP
jgi:hypothetical protein